jgi:hypothetical protein
MWSGSVGIERLHREVELLLVLRMVEPSADFGYRTTDFGRRLLEATQAHWLGEVPG